MVDMNGELMSDKEEIRIRFKERLNNLLNFRGDKEAEMSCLVK